MQRRQNRAVWRQQPPCAAWLVTLLLFQALCEPAYAHGQRTSVSGGSYQKSGPPAAPSLSPSCSEHLLAPFTEPNSSAANNALRRIDASGRLPSALAYYKSFVSFGSYEECLHIKKSQYCRALAVLLPDISEPELVFTGWLGLCLPKDKFCNKDDVDAIYGMVRTAALCEDHSSTTIIAIVFLGGRGLC